jgi:hypothetical protein
MNWEIILMTVEIVNGADGGPLMKLLPEPGNSEDEAFISQFSVLLPTPTKMIRMTVEGHGQWLEMFNG